MLHGLGARDHGTLRIDLPPHGNAYAVVAQRIDRIEEPGMHLHKIDRAEIRNPRHPAARDPRRGIGKPKPLLITETFLCVLRRKAATDANASDASVVKTKRAASAISAGWIGGMATPEICDQKTLRMAGSSARARHSNMRG